MNYGKIAIVAVGCLLAIPVTMAVQADAHGEMGEFHGRAGMGHGYLGFLQGVQLTSSQRQQMHELMKAAWTQDKAQVKQLHALKTQISDAMASSGSVSADTMSGLQQQAAEIREKLDADRLSTAMQVRGLLTPDQLSQSASVHTQLKALHQQESALMQQGRSADGLPTAN
jgi:Spy/CpxP family protein refolding chaperone